MESTQKWILLIEHTYMYIKKKKPVPFEFGLGSKTEITNYAKAGYLRRLPYPLKQIILFLNEYFVHAFEF